MSKIKIIAVDDNLTFLQSIEFFINKNKNYNLINTAINGEQAIQLDNIHEADIILMDIEMPTLNGIDATKRLLKENNNLKVIALTNYVEKAYLYNLIVVGFKGCVFKKNTTSQIDNAITSVMDDKYFFPKDILVQIQ